MSEKQPEALRLANALDSFIAASGLHSDGVTARCSEMLRRLHAQNAQILEALRMNAQALAWIANGKCRGFHPKLPTANDALDAARAAIKAVEKQP